MEFISRISDDTQRKQVPAAREVFLIEANEKIILFSGTAGFIMEISSEERARVNKLISRPSFNLQELSVLFPELDIDRLQVDPPVNDGVLSGNKGFQPDAAVLFPTLDCHLRCTFCYSSGGEQKIDMDRFVARATIDFIIRNAVGNHSEECGLEFHGGGEPTWNWPVFEFSLDYFEAQARKHGLLPAVSLATNGMLSLRQIDRIAACIPKVQVSLDGMADIQNVQRPTSTNKRSFPIVSHTVSALLGRGVAVTIHSVITERGIGRIPEIVRFFGENFPGAAVQIEPNFPCGRGSVTNERFPSTTLFVKGLIEAFKVAETLGVDITYSGVNPQLDQARNRFCGITVPNFIVTPTGLVTACNEVAEMKHPFAKYFIYGCLDRSTERFMFDYERIAWLHSYRSSRHPECGECLARFMCAGECLVKNMSAEGVSRPSLMNPRCMINRELTRFLVVDRIRNKKERR